MKRRGLRIVTVATMMIIAMAVSGCGKAYTKEEFKSQLEEQLEKQEKSDEEQRSQSDEIYNSIAEKTDESYYSMFDNLDSIKGESGTADKWLWGLAFGVYQKFVHYIPWIIGISFVSGSVLAGIARKNKQVQRFAIFGLMIGVPVIIICLYVGTALWSTAA